MFLCPTCHPEGCNGFELKSIGKCEGCGVGDTCFDCHSHLPVNKPNKKKLYTVTIEYVVQVVASDPEEAIRIGRSAVQSGDELPEDESAEETKVLSADWVKALPYGEQDNREELMCGQILAMQEMKRGKKKSTKAV